MFTDSPKLVKVLDLLHKSGRQHPNNDALFYVRIFGHRVLELHPDISEEELDRRISDWMSGYYAKKSFANFLNDWIT